MTGIFTDLFIYYLGWEGLGQVYGLRRSQGRWKITRFRKSAKVAMKEITSEGTQDGMKDTGRNSGLYMGRNPGLWGSSRNL